MFHISQQPIENLNLNQSLISSKAGAFNSFEGRVRDHNEGKKVIALEYEAYESLCQSEAGKIFHEVRTFFDNLPDDFTRGDVRGLRSQTGLGAL